MFGDIGFWELVVILIVALVVIGPERLPDLARKAGMWYSRGRRLVQSVKEDIDRELAADELKRILKEHSDSAGIHQIIEETKSELEEAKSTLKDTAGALKQAKTELESQESEYVLSASPDKDKAKDQTAPASEPIAPSKTSSSEHGQTK